MVDNDFQQELSKNVWSDTYKWETDIRVNDTYRRTSKCIASKEKRSAKWEEIFYSLLSNKRYVPAGRILSNAGVGLKSTSFINCFVSGFKDASQDSIKSIYSELKRQAQILASEGGYGFCCDVLRPRGSYINGIGVGSPGSVEFLKLWDTSSQVITMGSGLKSTKGKGKIRKGAMMVTKSIWHPDIEEFITAKREEGVLTKFNMSVLVSNKFMEACKKNKKWD